MMRAQVPVVVRGTLTVTRIFFTALRLVSVLNAHSMSNDPL